MVKRMENPDEKQKREARKLARIRHPHVEMGIPPPANGIEGGARAGSTFDPKMFKGNIQLHKHLNEVAVSMLTKHIETSKSYKKGKTYKRNRVIDEYGIKMPEKERERLQDADSDDAREEIGQELFDFAAVSKLN